MNALLDDRYQKKLGKKEHYIWSTPKANYDEDYSSIVAEYVNLEYFDEYLWKSDKDIFEINNSKFEIDRKLKHIKNTIIESERILSLEDDWDDDGALKANRSIYMEMIKTLVNYSNYVNTKYNHIISSPEINIVRDGSIDLEWRSSSFILLINMQNDLRLHFYGEDLNSSIIMKGIINQKDFINDDLAFWMQKLKK